MTCSSSWDEDGRELLRDLEFGTDGLRYTVLSMDKDVDRFTGSHCLTLREDDVVVAVFGLSSRTVPTRSGPIQAYYRTLLGVAKHAMGRGFGSRIAKAARQHFLLEATEPTMLYGFIEQGNARSMRVQERLGYQPLREFEATQFGWLRTRRAEGARRLEQADLDGVRSQLIGFESDLTRMGRGTHIDPEAYWVLERNGEAVAGVQAHEKRLNITHLPGLDGRLLVRMNPVLKHVHPYLNLRPHAAVWCGNAFFRDSPIDLMRLVQHTCFAHGVSGGQFYLDPEAPIYGAVHEAGLGWLGRLAPSPRITIMAGYQGVDEATIAELERRPLAFSPLDSA
ncbi:MAG: hypothetical protein KC912_13835 [Proteobacteria bacterium]|nr:hypothetical protein [Pseudomonadota bacterium]